jgi:hypothetical protein
MMLELKDVIHHHLGCIIQTPEGFGRFLAMYAECSEPVVCADTVKSDWEVHDVKPVLRRMDTISQAHYADVAEIESATTSRWFRAGKITAYLAQYHYDVFGLIERGLAVDVATLEVNPYNVPAPRIVVESPQRSEDL